MAQESGYQFSDEERNLFRFIAEHVRTNHSDYKQAGKWLDEYCSESAYWSRKKDELERLKKNRGTLPEGLYQRDVASLEKEITEKRTLPPLIRFNEAKKYFSDKYKDLELIPKAEAEKIILITWLITDPDAENTKLNITEFENWRWEPLDDVFKLSRGYKGFLFAQNKAPWMRLVHISWGKIAVSKYKGKRKKLVTVRRIVGTIIFLAALTTLLLNLDKIRELCKGKMAERTTKHTDNLQTAQLNEPNNYGRTALYSRTKKRVYDICERIEEEKLNPWLFINIDKIKPVTMHNGKVISYKGVLYEGSPRLIFWSDDFIPPFLEDTIVQVFDETIEDCRKNSLEPKPYIDEANSILFGFILHIYSRMAEIDQKLSSAVDSKKAGRRDVSAEVEKMRRCLKEHYDAAILLASRNENASVNLKD